MKAQALLSRLTKVKPTSRTTWLACCPAHDDKSPSLTVCELDDGRVLLHCFANCAVEDVLAAVGLTFDALFPDNPIPYAKPLRKPFPAADVLEALANEAAVVEIAAADTAAGKQINRARLLTAVARIHAGRDLIHG